MRKFTLLTIALVCISFISNAQISKGSTFLGGSVYLNSNSSKDDAMPINENKSTNWGIKPQFGKAISTNKIVGLSLNYTRSGNEYNNGTYNSKADGSSFGAGVFYRSYYPLSNRFFLFGEGALEANFGENERTTNDILAYKEKNTLLHLSITPGFSFAASKKLHLEASLNSLLSFSYLSLKGNDYNAAGTIVKTSKANQVNGGANSNGFSGLSVGLRWILPSKK
jgi:hypothetical protein